MPLTETEPLGRDHISLEVRIDWLVLPLSQPARFQIPDVPVCATARTHVKTRLASGELPAYITGRIWSPHIFFVVLSGLLRLVLRRHLKLHDWADPLSNFQTSCDIDVAHCLWPERRDHPRDLSIIDISCSQWQMQRWCWVNCPPTIYVALYYLRQENSALLNISNE